MSFLQARHDSVQRRYDIRGTILDKELAFSSNEAVLTIKQELVNAVVEHMMTKLTPHLDRAIEQAFAATELTDKPSEQ